MLTPGTILQNRYRIVSLLGQGGMGAVYRAWDLRLNVAVAVKEMVPQPGIDAQTLAGLRQQFYQEAQVLARLSHPNLVRVTDYFEEGGNAYLVMDFVEGQSLADFIAQQGPLPEAQVLEWARQLLDALAYCHARGVIHRDIKPQNIIITPSPVTGEGWGGGRAVLVDFGLVKLWDPRDPRTQTVMRGMGTPEYAPPEQYGITGHTDPRSDLYSLGATLYHALTGQAPPTPVDRIANPGIFCPLRALNSQISLRTEQAVLKAMELNQGLRWPSAAEMAQGLGLSAPTQIPIPSPAPFPSQTGTSLAKPLPLREPLTRKITTFLGLDRITRSFPTQSWTIRLSSDLDTARYKLLYETQGSRITTIAQVLDQNTREGRNVTVLIRGVEGCGGTSIAMEVKNLILNRSANMVTLVATIDFSGNLDEPVRALEKVIRALRRSDSPISSRLRKAVENTWREMREIREAEYEGHRKETKTISWQGFPLSIEVITQWGRASLGPKYTREEQIEVQRNIEPLSEQQKLFKLIALMEDLVDYLLMKGVRIILIFDKLKNIGDLASMIDIINAGRVGCLIVASQGDYARWREEHPELLRRFQIAQDSYIPCIWDLPKRLCRTLTQGIAEADTPELLLFETYLAYKGRGLPGRVFREIRGWLDFMPHTTAELFSTRLGLKPKGWLVIQKERRDEIILFADVQQLLEKQGWPQIFSGPLSIESLGVEKSDLARLAIYELTDWLIKKAQCGEAVSKRMMIEYAINCGLPFQRQLSLQIVTRFAEFLTHSGKIRLRPARGLDLSGMIAIS